MRLFEIDPDAQVATLNKTWISLIPQFKELITRDKGSKGDSDGRKKLQATKEFTYIYFYTDFGSPFRDLPDEDKHKEACGIAGLEPFDVRNDDDLKIAIDYYKKLIFSATRSFRSYESMLRGVASLDNYMETTDFAAVAKDGSLLHDPSKLAKNIREMEQVYDSLSKFAKRVENDLQNADTGIRGKGDLGDKEMLETPHNSKWKEDDIATRSRATAGLDSQPLQVVPSKMNFSDIAQKVKRTMSTIKGEDADESD